jgi:uncharacterized membrane protein (DUF485 family)
MMDAFLINITSFPTAIYTTGLVVVIGYWIIAFIGNFDFDAFDVGIDVDLDTDGESSEIGRIAALLSTLGLTGVPITVVITFLILNAWFISYFASMLTPNFPDLVAAIQTLIGIAIVIGSLLFSILVTNIMIRPLKGMFRKLNQEPISKSLLGSTCRIRSSRADNSFGEAECRHEGASLIVKVRATGETTYSTDETVVVIGHNKGDDTFLVVSENEFKKQTET